MRNYWIYVWSSLLSLLGSNLYVFTQAWFLLEISGQKTSVGVTWTLFFLPSLLLLPIVGRLLDSSQLKKTLMHFELAKIILLLGFALLLKQFPSTELAYAMSILYGVAFVSYYPSVYVMIKRLIPTERQTKYSHLFETAFQAANVGAVFSSGFIYERIGFTNLLILSAGLVTSGYLLLSFIALEESSTGPTKLLEGYRKVARLFSNVMTGNTSLQSPRAFIFGLLHPTPQAVILVSNVPLILFVSDLMKGGPIEFGIIDSIVGMAGFVVSLAWAKWTHLSENISINFIVNLTAGVSMIVMGFVSPVGVWPYLWISVAGGLMISAKVLARGAVVRVVPKEEIGSFSTLFQMFGNLIMMSLFAVISMISSHTSVTSLYVLLGLVMIAYSFVAGRLMQDKPQAAVSAVKS